MAEQLSHPHGAYVCGFCSFTSPDQRVLVKHLMGHCGFKEKKHEHILWCGLCKPSLTDANHVVHQQAVTNETHLNGSVYHDNDLGYVDSSNYYPGYSGLYNPYAFPGTYYYPMNLAYRDPCYENINGYYQTHDTIFYTDDFYDGTDFLPILNTPGFIESSPENKYHLDVPHDSENPQDANSFARSLSFTSSDFELNSNDSNSLHDSGIETLSVNPQIFPVENVTHRTPYHEFCEMGPLSKSKTNAELNVGQSNELVAISNIEPQPGVNNSIQSPPDKTFSRKLISTQAKKLSNKEMTDPKLNTIKRNSVQKTDKASQSETVVKNLSESSNLKFFSEASSKDVSGIVGTKSVTEANTINMNDNTLAVSVVNKDCSEIPTKKLAEPSENINESSTKELTPVLLPEAACTEKTVKNDASDVTNRSIGIDDTLSINTLTQDSNSSQLHACEREKSSEKFLRSSISAQDTNFKPISNFESSLKGNATILTEDTSLVETGSIDVSDPRKKNDLNEKHSEHPTGKLESLSKIRNTISVLPENDTPVSAVQLPRIKAMVVGENRVLDNKIQSVRMNGDPRLKIYALCNNKRASSLEIDKRRSQMKTGTRKDVPNRNSHRRSNNCSETKSESSKCLSDKTVTPSDVCINIRNSCRSDLNDANNGGPVTILEQTRLTYSEVVKRGLPLKSSS